MDAIIPKRDPTAMLRLIVEEGIVRRGGQWYQDCLTAMKGCDVVICPLCGHPCSRGCDSQGCPVVHCNVLSGLHQIARLRAVSVSNWGRAFNAIVWKLAQLRLASSIDVLFNQFIASVGGQPVIQWR